MGGGSRPPHVSEHGVLTQISIFLHYYLGFIFLFNIIVNFEKNQIQKTLKQKVGSGLRGSGPYTKRIPSELACWVLKYGIMVGNFQGIFLNFQIIFQFLLYTHFMSPIGGS